MEGNLITVALIGHPDSGKSSIFYGLCKTSVSFCPPSAFPVPRGTYRYCDQEYLLLDLPETRSLASLAPDSAFGFEQETFTEQILSSGRADILVLTCSAFCLERGLKLLTQLLGCSSIKEEATPIVLCINFCNEAEAKGIHIDFDLLEDVLQIPVLPCYAFSATCLDDLKTAVSSVWGRLFSYECLDFSPKKLAAETTSFSHPPKAALGDKINALFANPAGGIGLSLAFFLFLLWFTVIGARWPSLLLWRAFYWLEKRMVMVFTGLCAPDWFICCFIYGIYRMLAWIISIMLPPMVICVFLYTLFEHMGILSRIAFWLDPLLERCRSCGRHGLCMGMALNCHAAGVGCCRRIVSPRERAAALLTIPLMPCAGRFPTFFTLASFFFAAETGKGPGGTFRLILFFTLILISALIISLGASALLSSTLLRRLPSIEILELPTFHQPQIRKTLFPEVFDHCLFLLGKAASAAIPAGLLLWLSANTIYHGESLLNRFSQIVNPLGEWMGLDGIILTVFILGFSGNEIILPLLFTAYLQTGNLLEFPSFLALKQLLISHGWTWKTALSMTILMLFHWPCRTALSSIKKETQSWKWTLVSFLLPTLTGTGLCILVTEAGKLFSGIL